MFAKLRHFFTPHHTNNYRARVLHNSILTLIIAAFLTFTAATHYFQSTPLKILGFKSSVTVQEVIEQTNKERVSHGLKPLKISQQLSQAAKGKAQDMFINDYWAHTSSAGLTPWDFIIDAGYSYSYAGENLAKDFRNTQSMLRAWMNSPTHRENIISDKYEEVGITVLEGNLQGEDTVLVVQMFGNKTAQAGQVTAQEENSQTQEPSIAGQQEEIPQVAEITPQEEIQAQEETKEIITPPQPHLLDNFNLKKTASITITSLMLAVLLLDLVIAESKNLSRRVGKNWAHLIFINVILIAMTAMHTGAIL